MKQVFKKIDFDKISSDFQFDFVNYEDVLKKNPASHSQFEFHRVSFYVVILITHSTSSYNLNFKDYQLKKGALITLRKDNIHKFFKSKAKGVLLAFTDDFVVNHSNKIEASKLFLLFNEMLASPVMQLNAAEYKEMLVLMNMIREEYLQVNDPYSPNIIRNYFQIIITKLFRIKSKHNVVLENNKYLSMFLEFQDLVEKNCFNQKKVSFYANKMAVTSKTLSNVTQSIIDKSAKVFINDIVIIQAKRLIINSRDSLTEISYQIGFTEPSNFFKYFTKYAGISPLQFRALYQVD